MECRFFIVLASRIFVYVHIWVDNGEGTMSCGKIPWRFILICRLQNLYVAFNCAARFSAVEHLTPPWNLNSQSIAVNVHDFISSVWTYSGKKHGWRWLMTGRKHLEKLSRWEKFISNKKVLQFTVSLFFSHLLLTRSSSLAMPLLLPHFAFYAAEMLRCPAGLGLPQRSAKRQQFASGKKEKTVEGIALGS